MTRLLVGLGALHLVVAGALAAQGAPPPEVRGPFGLPGVQISGTTEISSELYQANGIRNRRPGSSWQLAMRPTITLFGELTAGVDLLLTNEGNEFRQNINQIGISPQWRWVTAHLGDFSQQYSPYTVSGVRVRGAGVDLRPGLFRFSLQGGRTQRPVFAGSEGTVFQRNMLAAKLGVGNEGSSFLDLNIVKARDDITRRELGLLVIDSTLIDTLPGGAFRPQIGTRPQENLVAGLQGQLTTWQRRLVLRGEVAAALITNDLTAPLADSLGDGPSSPLAPFQDLRLSTSGDYAYNVDAALNLRRVRMRTTYEYVGPGYTSLGLAYLIGDRESIGWDGSWQLPGDRVILQGQVRRMGDNLAGTRTYTSNRDTYGGAVVMRFTDLLTGTVSAMQNVVANDAVVDTFVVDVRALALTGTVSSQQEVFGKRTVLSLAYAYQNSLDGNTVTNIPDVLAQNVSVTTQVFLTDRFSLAPSVAAVATELSSGQRANNVQLGLRASGSAFRDRMRLSAALTNARTTQGRDVSGFNAQASWELPGAVRANLTARSNRYSAFGPQRAFDESAMQLSFTRAW